jgi:hypothetical protein
LFPIEGIVVSVDVLLEGSFSAAASESTENQQRADQGNEESLGQHCEGVSISSLGRQLIEGGVVINVQKDIERKRNYHGAIYACGSTRHAT